ncbi:MAG: type II toxin-antitoxin system RelE/ParE family toxin [Sphaerospermopsis sp. SIO1G1]|nr:type II toxin-antitoxin system RelE/ParE family toxin [Sphaerospermopsis sp. SIO1G1]
MTSLIRTAQAEEDLIEIWLYIATDNSQVVADRIIDQIDAKCQILAKNPGIGQARPDIAPELRYFPVGSYLILYREITNGIEVVRVVHGARNLPNI